MCWGKGGVSFILGFFVRFWVCVVVFGTIWLKAVALVRLEHEQQRFYDKAFFGCRRTVIVTNVPVCIIIGRFRKKQSMRL